MAAAESTDDWFPQWVLRLQGLVDEGKARMAGRIRLSSWELNRVNRLGRMVAYAKEQAAEKWNGELTVGTVRFLVRPWFKDARGIAGLYGSPFRSGVFQRTTAYGTYSTDEQEVVVTEEGERLAAQWYVLHGGEDPGGFAA